MERIKTFGKYALWIMLFWILSDILIHIGLNSTYKNIKQRGETPAGVEVVQMQATTVNGRAKVKVNNPELKGKFLKLDLYSSTGVNLGTQYIELSNMDENNEIETYFKISEVKSYELAIVDEKGVSTEGFMDTALSTLTVLGIVIKLLAL